MFIYSHSLDSANPSVLFKKVPKLAISSPMMCSYDKIGHPFPSFPHPFLSFLSVSSIFMGDVTSSETVLSELFFLICRTTYFMTIYSFMLLFAAMSNLHVDFRRHHLPFFIIVAPDFCTNHALMSCSLYSLFFFLINFSVICNPSLCHSRSTYFPSSTS